MYVDIYQGLQNTPSGSQQRGICLPFNKSPGYDTKPFDGESPVLEFLAMWSTSSYPLIPDSL